MVMNLAQIKNGKKTTTCDLNFNAWPFKLMFLLWLERCTI